MAKLVLGVVVGNDGSGITPSDDDGRATCGSIDVRVEEVFRTPGESWELEHAGGSVIIHQYMYFVASTQYSSVVVKLQRERAPRTHSTGLSSPQRPPDDTARCSSVRHPVQAIHREYHSRPSPRRSGRFCRICRP